MRASLLRSGMSIAFVSLLWAPASQSGISEPYGSITIFSTLVYVAPALLCQPRVPAKRVCQPAAERPRSHHAGAAVRARPALL